MSWSYRKDNYGSHAAALENCYGDTLVNNEELRLCVAQIKMAEARIDQIMEKLEDD